MAQVQAWSVYVQNLLVDGTGLVLVARFGIFLVFTPPFYFLLLSNCEPHVLKGVFLQSCQRDSCVSIS